LKALEQDQFDLIFLDVQMPEMDGLEAARKITKNWPPDRRPRLVAMTGNALMGDREKCLAAGMDDYISKPIRIAELQAAIERWGPTKKPPTGTTSFRQRDVAPDMASDLLDSDVLAELRDMPPTDGISMLRELIDLFLDSAPKRIKQIRDAAHEPTNLAFHAHALKSMGMNMGAQKIVQLTKRLEEMGRDGNTDQAAQVIAELENTFVLTRAQLETMRESAT
jgi:response regulator RpfG family c-di-GMP phosphodiesterase